MVATTAAAEGSAPGSQMRLFTNKVEPQDSWPKEISGSRNPEGTVPQQLKNS